MRRREFMGALIGALAVARSARAQESGRVYRVAYLGPAPKGSPAQRAFFAALAKLGFVEGKNLEADPRGYGLRPEQFTRVAQTLVADSPDLLICGGPEPAKAGQQATKTIPLLAGTDDMVGEGLVASLPRPGGNTTGVSIFSSELDGKRFEILLELLQGVKRVDALAGSDTGSPEHLEALQGEAGARGVELVVHKVNSYGEIGPAVEAAKAGGAAGLNVLGSALLFGNRQVIFERAAVLGLPAIYEWPEYAREGGLIGYGPSIVHIYGDQLSRMAGDILRGTKPADIPVEHPTRFYLAVNLKAAKALSLEIPQTVLARADEVVE
jgi:putative ABC transport system substrate-binding protein